MLFAFICRDKPGEGPELRAKSRPEHLAWIEGLGDRIKAAGPLMDDDCAEPRGSLLIVEADDLDAARALSKTDPYAISGVFESVTVQPWKWLFGKPEGV